MRERKIFYGWWLTVVAGIVMAITSVPVFHANAVWVVAIQSTFPEWSRFQLSLALTMDEASKGGLFGVAGLVGTGLTASVLRRMVMIGLLAFPPPSYSCLHS